MGASDSVLRIDLPDEAATLALGAQLVAVARPGTNLHLRGDLGAGKTTMVRGLLRALGYRGRVKSPTFTLVESYVISRLELHHFDFYRFEEGTDLDDAGFRDAFDGCHLCIVEWPEKAVASLPEADLMIFLEHAENGRIANVIAYSPLAEQFLTQMKERCNDLR